MTLRDGAGAPAQVGALRRLRAVDLLLVSLGAMVGALTRWSLGEAVPDGSGFPWTTFAINVAGCFALALLPMLRVVRLQPTVAIALGPGLLGGFTTVSAYAEQARSLAADGHSGLAGTYVLGTVTACLLAAVAGRAISHRPEPEGALE
ncbi:hypothetical protein DDE18_02155 [Nocardioides gansuensis]|uniref:Fluoride-specific ion channel FluC n=1 Tax=Nocardioides gansuensis TaxID=2138300 RepID=A0A2T8FFE1_9ACTN|nr:CrcB family protein [Nocardioides gansuensis]PVG84438.1 hypothetical protein DDE18_02155 [Nocardioides gansuensis]